MNKLNRFTSAGNLYLFATLLLLSCKSGLNDRQKVFLDYAKLEDRYSNSGFYRNLDLYNTNIDEPKYTDSSFKLANFKVQLKKTFRLVIDGNQLQTDFEGPELQYPHQYRFKPQQDGSIQVSLSVFIPDSYTKFSLSKKDIGKPMLKDSAEITLLDMTNDGATLLVENKGSRQSYDYTYDSIDKKDFNEKKNDEPHTGPGYGNNLFISESVERPNASTTTVKDSLLNTDLARLNISLSDDHGKTLLTEGRINDFRHYLWYRNHDMPFPELMSAYSDIRSRYVEEDIDSLHKFNPIYVVNIKASGKVDQVNFLIRSAKGHVETIDLGNQIPQQPKQEQRPIATEFLPIVNLTKENAVKLLKVNYTTIAVKNNEPDYFLLYASAPIAHNNRQMHLSFEDIELIGAQKDTVKVNDYEDAKTDLNTSWTTEVNNLSAVKFPASNLDVTKIIGKINLSTADYYDKEFKVNQLPKGAILASNGLTLTVNKQNPAFEDLVEIYGLDDKDQTHPIASIFPDNYFAKELPIIYVKKPAKFIFRYKKADGEINQVIPFEFQIQKKEK